MNVQLEPTIAAVTHNAQIQLELLVVPVIRDSAEMVLLATVSGTDCIRP